MKLKTELLGILLQLEQTASRNEKLDILRTNKHNDVLKRFFELSLNPLITFGIKKIPAYGRNGPTVSLGDAFQQLDKLINRELTGNAAIDFLSNLLSSLDIDDAEVLQRVIDKDPKCGVAGATVNAVWDNLIFDFPVMKASPHDEKTIKNISFPALSQLKLDGARCALVVDNGKVTLYSANGREIEHHGQFNWFATITNNVVIDGELLVTDEFGKFMERKKGNGIVNRAVKGTIPASQAKQLHFVTFDIIDIKDWKTGFSEVHYRKRFINLAVLNSSFRSNASVVATKEVRSEREAIAHFKDLYSKGEEGTILKDFASVWENKRSKYQIKMKGILTCDLQVISVEEGTGKNTGKLGALVCASSDGKIEVNVGTGFTDQDRAEKFEFWLGEIVEVQYNAKITSKSNDKMSLFLPRFVQVRNDKNQADSVENIPG